MYRKYFKRVFDFIIALVALVLLSVLLLPIIILLLLTGENEVFYLQERVGYKNRKFTIIKFATMLKISPQIGTGSITLRNDPRVTRVGRFLRKTKINELPQFVNVLLGDMSIVGPRPLMEVDFLKFSPEIARHFYEFKPGITGIASLVFRDEEKLYSTTKMDPHEYDRLYLAPYKGALEQWYRKHCNIITDMKILLLTAYSVLFPGKEIVYKIFRHLPEKWDRKP